MSIHDKSVRSLALASCLVLGVGLTRLQDTSFPEQTCPESLTGHVEHEFEGDTTSQTWVNLSKGLFDLEENRLARHVTVVHLIHEHGVVRQKFILPCTMPADSSDSVSLEFRTEDEATHRIDVRPQQGVLWGRVYDAGSDLAFVYE